MSVIVWDGKLLASDSQVTDGSMRRTTTKIRRVEKGKFKGFLLGAAGATATANLLMDWFEQGAKAEHFPYEYAKSDMLGATLVAITKDKVILRYDHLPVPIIMEDEVYCTGSGRDFAYGAIAMGADAIKAVEVACQYSTECGGEVAVLKWRKVK
jgi:ATP-dependent protease HslVU (ClpYQ) peptidase subunit